MRHGGKTMARTVVALIGTYAAAQKAVQDLKDRGFSDADIHVTSNDCSVEIVPTGGAVEADSYSEGIREHGTWVTVSAAEDTAAGTAAILNRHGVAEVKP